MFGKTQKLMSESPTEEQRKKNQRQNIGCLAIVISLIVASIFYFTKDKSKTVDDTPTTTSIEVPIVGDSVAGPPAPAGPDAYEIMEGVFIGEPEKEKVQPLIETVMQRYGMTINNENLTRVANMLFALRKESKVGVTEMDILKHIYQKGSAAISLPDQAGLSATTLELTK